MGNWGIAETLWSSLGIAGVMLMWMTQVGPKQAVSHVAEWACTFGAKNPPLWLQSGTADRAVRHAAGIVLVIWVAGFVFVFDIGSLTVGQKLLFAIGCLLIVGAIVWRIVDFSVTPHQPDIPSRPVVPSPTEPPPDPPSSTSSNRRCNERKAALDLLG